MLEAHIVSYLTASLRIPLRVAPEVSHRGNTLDTVTSIRTVIALAFMVEVAAIILQLRLVPIDQQCKVGKFTINQV